MNQKQKQKSQDLEECTEMASEIAVSPKQIKKIMQDKNYEEE